MIQKRWKARQKKPKARKFDGDLKDEVKTLITSLKKIYKAQEEILHQGGLRSDQISPRKDDEVDSTHPPRYDNWWEQNQRTDGY
jgi:hypothetical protein